MSGNPESFKGVVNGVLKITVDVFDKDFRTSLTLKICHYDKFYR